MNLLLHGLDATRIDPENAYASSCLEIGEMERVDVIVTNPPLAAKEREGHSRQLPGRPADC
jgi:type I restriction-modification system DNA methylase subunit